VASDLIEVGGWPTKPSMVKPPTLIKYRDVTNYNVNRQFGSKPKMNVAVIEFNVF
jgi:hypothetical protein